jgi:hypothetical protein
MRIAPPVAAVARLTTEAHDRVIADHKGFNIVTAIAG